MTHQFLYDEEFEHENAMFFHQKIFLLIGSYGMMVMIKNSETPYTPMGTAYTPVDTFMIQNTGLNKGS